jgi:hypothetical protein
MRMWVGARRGCEAAGGAARGRPWTRAPAGARLEVETHGSPVLPPLLFRCAGDCALGDDMLTTGNANEIQLFSCRLVQENGGTEFFLTYKELTTVAIPVTAAALDVEVALEALPTMRDVRVTILGQTFTNTQIVEVCHPQAVVQVEFLQENGEYVAAPGRMCAVKSVLPSSTLSSCGTFGLSTGALGAYSVRVCARSCGRAFLAPPRQRPKHFGVQGVRN